MEDFKLLFWFSEKRKIYHSANENIKSLNKIVETFRSKRKERANQSKFDNERAKKRAKGQGSSTPTNTQISNNVNLWKLIDCD